jgi:hypothetical protein
MKIPIRILVVLLPLLFLGGAAVVSARSADIVQTEVGGTRAEMVITTTGSTGQEALVYYLFDEPNVVTPTWSMVTTGTFQTSIDTASWTLYWQSAKVMAAGQQTMTVNATSEFQIVSWAPEFWEPRVPYTRETYISGTLNAMQVKIEGAFGDEHIAVYITDTQTWFTPTWSATGAVGEYTTTIDTATNFPVGWQSAKIDHRGPQEIHVDANSDFEPISWAPDFWMPKTNAALKNRVYLPIIF